MDFTGKTVLITGAARGQGRSHARRFAELGADLVLVDICAEIESIPYRQSTESDLRETVRSIEHYGRRVIAEIADVRDAEAMADVAGKALANFGGIDVICANAGVISIKPAVAVTATDWADVIGTNLTGVWNTVSPLLPSMIERERGSIVITSSAAGLKGPPNMVHYSAAKSGLIGMMRSLAAELGPHNVRVNCVAPTTVDTPMVHWPEAYQAFRPDLENPDREDVEPIFASLNVIPVPWIQPVDVTNAVVWLASDEARYVTGIVLPVDAGTVIK